MGPQWGGKAELLLRRGKKCRNETNNVGSILVAASVSFPLTLGFVKEMSILPNKEMRSD